jgi:hypothetical protein
MSKRSGEAMNDKIKRSEVYFGRIGDEYGNVNNALAKGLKYYAYSRHSYCNVYLADFNRTNVCKVSDLIDNREQ